MARPPVALISKDKVCEIALEIIDSAGIDAVTIRRIAAEINVNGASLYHHFQNKEEILAGATEMALSEAHTERIGEETWKSWCLRNAERLYAVVRKHPNLIPILIRRNALRLAFNDLEFYFGEFERQGLSIRVMWMLMESLQAFTIGMLQHNHMMTDDLVDVSDDYPNIQRATKDRLFSQEEEFRIGCKALVEAVERYNPGVPPMVAYSSERSA
jgi:TetR/AcrR family transcriptional regulator, tetracycline repressor protein